MTQRRRTTTSAATGGAAAALGEHALEGLQRVLVRGRVAQWRA